ncbi:MAG TPA: hypothetical protein EYM75_07670 [Dehalococcoidia bacterium]|nr:hypothetical protein [Dehalococcoidia bacterium]
MSGRRCGAAPRHPVFEGSIPEGWRGPLTSQLISSKIQVRRTQYVHGLHGFRSSGSIGPWFYAKPLARSAQRRLDRQNLSRLHRPPCCDSGRNRRSQGGLQRGRAHDRGCHDLRPGPGYRPIGRGFRGSGVHIIACTGNHLAVPRDFAASTPPAIALHFIREIQEGIEGSGINAGIIKVASDRGGITPAQECRR